MTIHISKYSRLGLLEILILLWKYSNERIARIAIAIPCQRKEGGGPPACLAKIPTFF